MNMILGVAVLILIAYIFSQRSYIAGLKTRINRLNRQWDDCQKIHNKQAMQIEVLQDENDALNSLVDDYEMTRP